MAEKSMGRKIRLHSHFSVLQFSVRKGYPMHGFRLKTPCVALFSLWALIAAISPGVLAAEPAAQRLLYVASPGIRNDLQFGGAGILVFNIDGNHTFVKRIETSASRQSKPENIKGVCASAATGRLYFTTLTRLYCLDLATEKEVWSKALPGGCDRLSITPDGKRLYVPSLEGPHWNVVDGQTGDVVTKIETKSGSHNTVTSTDGTRIYCAGLKSPLLTVVDAAKNEIVSAVGPFSAEIRPFTINGEKTRCYVTVNRLLGFEIGDLTTGKFLERVEVKGGGVGTPTRHGTPSHGVGLTPDEREIWVCDSVGRAVHIFDNTGAHPRQVGSVALREEPGWITFSVDGHFAYPSTGDVIDMASRKVVTQLQDEKGRPVESEKLLEIDFRDGKVFRTGDQFGIGRAGKP
jgi:DNA-binding beta-propeller fold protein YncE